jgi:transcriptional regulator with XRE-family HTH domain
MNTTIASPVGEHLRTWRQRRHLSQLDLAMEADISTKHLSFLETGRSQPSREMILNLAHHLRVPLREQNTLLQAAGYAPHFSSGSLDRPNMESARRTIDLLLKAHEPFPALAVDRHWNMVAANSAIAPLLDGIADFLMEPPVNVIRLSLHPDGGATRIVNYLEWRTHIIERLERQLEMTADPVIEDLLAEVRAYPISDEARRNQGTNRGLDRNVAIPMQMLVGGRVMSFLSTTTVFGTPTDVTLSELAIETFFPADEATAKALAG